MHRDDSAEYVQRIKNQAEDIIRKKVEPLLDYHLEKITEEYNQQKEKTRLGYTKNIVRGIIEIHLHYAVDIFGRKIVTDEKGKIVAHMLLKAFEYAHRYTCKLSRLDQNQLFKYILKKIRGYAIPKDKRLTDFSKNVTYTSTYIVWYNEEIFFSTPTFWNQRVINDFIIPYIRTKEKTKDLEDIDQMYVRMKVTSWEQLKRKTGE